MNFKKYYKKLSPDQKISLAQELETSVVYLSQLANGHRNAGGKFLLNINSATKGQVMPHELRFKDEVKAA